MATQLPANPTQNQNYTQYAREEIENTNFYLLKHISMLSTALLALALAALMLTGAVLSTVVSCAVTFMLHMSLCVVVHSRSEEIIRHFRAIHVLTLFYLGSLLALTAYLSAFGTGNQPGVFFAPIVIVLTMIFILPAWQSSVTLSLASVLFVWMSSLAKTYAVFHTDLSIAGATVLFGLIAIYEFYMVRIREYHLQSELMKRSSTDGLTGLMNKITAENSAREYLEQHASEQSAALMVIDLDQFKLINDRMGHQTGDEVLEAFGETLLNLFRSQDIIGRVGGDEFLVLMKNIGDTEMVVHRAEVICESANNILLKGYDSRLSCSIGIAMCPIHGMDYDTLFSIADEQLYMLKRNAKNLAQASA
jgi:diguanylate cyclase (GGDEF)-like protein